MIQIKRDGNASAGAKWATSRALAIEAFVRKSNRSFREIQRRHLPDLMMALESAPPIAMIVVLSRGITILPYPILNPDNK